MKPPRPMPTAPPFLTIYTNAYKRPAALARCMASVARQTAVEHLEQIVLPDHVGYGIVGGLYGRVPWYAEACRGDYVTMLCDDDELADERVVERLMAFARARGNPPVVIVQAEKGGLHLPSHAPDREPDPGEVDLCCLVMRRDVWLRHVNDWGMRYEGDYDMAVALRRAGYEHAWLDMLFAVGANSNGRPEAAAFA